MLPRTIDPSPHDPLLLRPLPTQLPPDPSALVSELAAQLHSLIDSSDADPVLLNTLAAGMRHATRSAQSTVNAGRVHSADARSALDDADADLRAVMYELGKVREAIAECDAYETEYERLELVPEDEFMKSAEKGVIEGLPSEAQERHYALTLLRLESELSTLISREDEVASLTKERDSLVRARREVRAKFDAVDVWLADYAKTTNAMASKIRDVTRVTNPPKMREKEAKEGGKEAGKDEGKDGVGKAGDEKETGRDKEGQAIVEAGAMEAAKDVEMKE